MERLATSEFQTALGVLEKCLETPQVPGELELWVQEAQDAGDRVSMLLAQQIDERHPDAFSEIEAQDANLAARVEEVRKGDLRSRELLEEFQSQLSRLARRARAVEADEKRAEDQLGEVVEAGLRFVIHARTQETALETWMTEAYKREDGAGD